MHLVALRHIYTGHQISLLSVIERRWSSKSDQVNMPFTIKGFQSYLLLLKKQHFPCGVYSARSIEEVVLSG